MSPITLTIPFLPPPLNRMYTHPKYRPQAKILSQEARVFQQKFRELINQDGRVVAMQDEVNHMIEMAKTCNAYYAPGKSHGHYGLALAVAVYKPTHYKKDRNPALRSGDTDGYVKLVKDCLFSALGVDDGWVITEMVRRLPAPTPRIELDLRLGEVWYEGAY